VFTAAINRADSMKDVSGRQAARAGDHRATGGTSAAVGADTIEILHDGRAAGAMNGAIYSTAARQCGIRRIHYRIGGHPRDIAHY
jgi:hypothetical protein